MSELGNHRRYQLTLKLGADTWQELLEALRQLRIDLNSLQTNGGEWERNYHSANTRQKWTVQTDIAFDHEMTHERYYRELEARLDALNRLMDEAEAESEQL